MIGWILIGVILHKLQMLHGWILFLYILGCLNYLMKSIRIEVSERNNKE